MTGRIESATAVPERLDATAVAAWLRGHPDFLVKHPDLAQVLAPPSPHQGNGALDLQAFMLERLRRDVAQLTSTREALIQATRENMTITGRVHEAVLLMLDATTFEHLIHIATQDCAELLGVDAVSLCVEAADGAMPKVSTQGVFALPHGAVDRLIGAGRAVQLREQALHTDVLYGPAASLVQSDALVRLEFSAAAPIGLLALGARETGKFHAGQGTELLSFFAKALARLIRQWLDLPPS